MARLQWALLIGAAAALCAAPLRAEILSSHSASTNPTSEGYFLTNTGVTGIGAAGPSGVGEFLTSENSWRVNDASASFRAFYSNNLTGLETLNARSGGWTLTSRVQVTDVNNAPISTRRIDFIDEAYTGNTNEMIFGMDLGSNASGQAVATLLGGVGSVTVGTGFNDYALSFDPLTRTSSLRVNGAPTPVLTSTGLASNVLADSTQRFGSMGSASLGAANYASVQLASTLSASTILAGYDFEDATSPRNSSIDANAETTAGSVTFGDPVGNANWFISSGTQQAVTRSDQTAASEALAVAANDYYSFTVNAPGAPMALDSLFLMVGGESLFGSGFTASWFVRSSVDGFGSTLGSLSVNVPAAGGGAMLSPLWIDLSAAEYQLLNSIEFRIFSYDNSSSTLHVGRLDDIVLRGHLVPEPSTLVLIGLGFAFAVGGIRRHARQRRGTANSQ